VIVTGPANKENDSRVKSFSPGALNRDDVTYVAGHRGLVGSAIWRLLESEGFKNLVGRTRNELDLKNRDAVFEFFAATKPRYVILAAAKVGGIAANDAFPVDFLSENLQVQVNVMDAALENNVERLLFLGSSCIYPKLAPQPLKEEYLLTGHLEPTNDAYAIAKIAGILQVQAVRRQYGFPWISAMPTNLYGPNDNFSLNESHVLPRLIRRYEEATRNGLDSVTNWGTGEPRREFLHVEDMARACLHLLENYDGSDHVNIGSGVDVTIAELAALVANSCDFAGTTNWDATRPDGTPQKLLDVSKLKENGWVSQISLEQGLASTIAWFRENSHLIRE
jgi:GDP-L-fucose synthase